MSDEGLTPLDDTQAKDHSQNKLSNSIFLERTRVLGVIPPKLTKQSQTDLASPIDENETLSLILIQKKQNKEQKETLRIGKKDTTDKLIQMAADAFHIHLKDIHLSHKDKEITKISKNTTLDQYVETGDVLIVSEHKNSHKPSPSPHSAKKTHPKAIQKVETSWNKILNTLGWLNRALFLEGTPTGPKTHTPGACGLKNLGNTCFMNSALQCLCHTEDLTGYFLKQNFYVNTKNPLGMEGKLALQFAAMVRKMYSGHYGYFVPSEVKSVVGKFAPRFNGFRQHDSQEFLAFFLDGLHEDTNSVTKKPYLPIPDEVERRPDEVVAAEAWERHFQRNQSVIVDHLQAQLRNTLICPQCKYVSVNFDPFMYLSLPLPPPKQTIEFIYFDPCFVACPMRYGVQLAGKKLVSTALKEMFEEPSLTPSNMLLFHSQQEDNRNSIIKAELKPNDYLTTNPMYKRMSYLIFDVPPAYSSLHRLFVAHVKLEPKKFGKGTKNIYISDPAVFFISELTGKQLYFFIWKRVQRILKTETRDERFSEVSSDDGYLLEDYDTFMDWIIIESAKNFDPTSLPFVLAFANERHVCICKGNCSGGCLVPMDDTPISNDCLTRLNVNWLKPAAIAQPNCITQDTHPSLKRLREESKHSKAANIKECVSLFSESEKLGRNDMWYCPTCKKHVQAQKKMDLWNTPDTLIIHLKRFSQNRVKINSLVDFPITGLDLSEFVLDPKSKGCLYDLFAISNHLGNMGGGHYTAIAKNGEQWFQFNDSNVKSCEPPISPSNSGYLLFYKRTTREIPPVEEEEEMEDTEETEDSVQ